MCIKYTSVSNRNGKNFIGLISVNLVYTFVNIINKAEDNAGKWYTNYHNYIEIFNKLLLLNSNRLLIHLMLIQILTFSICNSYKVTIVYC